MPELPEVETVVRTLRPHVVGRQITGAMVGAKIRITGHQHRPSTPRLALAQQQFRDRILGSVVDSIERYGKHIVFSLSGSDARDKHNFLLVHLGMTGRLTCESSADSTGKHTHLVLSLGDSRSRTQPQQQLRWLHFSDARRFGRIRVAERLDEEFSALGPDPLEISFDDFAERLRARRAMLKGLLLDQHFLRGIGNIYADESLFRAGIHPATIAAGLNRKQAQRLYDAIQSTLQAAIELGGSSISDYVDAQGQRGFFQLSHKVYQRHGEPCADCGSAIRRMIVASRSTHFCPRCQKRSRGRSLRGKR